jgi:hypothetical protein
VVFVVTRPLNCAECGKQLGRGSLVHFENDRPLCLECAVLGRLEFLPSGNVALTRRAAKCSKVHAVVLEWKPRRRRYERQGTLVEPAAIRQAERECAADADMRAGQRVKAAARRELEERAYVASFMQAVLAQFPGCPVVEAREIAAHACEKYSGRVGRTAAAKELDTQMVRLAVIAHVRHTRTDYDRIIDRLGDKRSARERIRDVVGTVLRAWEQPGSRPSVPGVPDRALALDTTPARQRALGRSRLRPSPARRGPAMATQ